MGLNLFSLLFGFSAVLANSLKNTQLATINTNQQVPYLCSSRNTFYHIFCLDLQSKLLKEFSLHSVFLAFFPTACWIIYCKGEFNSLYCTVYSGISIHTFPVVERPASLQCSPRSGLQPHLTGKHNRICRKLGHRRPVYTL